MDVQTMEPKAPALANATNASPAAAPAAQKAPPASPAAPEPAPAPAVDAGAPEEAPLFAVKELVEVHDERSADLGPMKDGSARRTTGFTYGVKYAMGGSERVDAQHIASKREADNHVMVVDGTLFLV
ncbi:hypothetical protein JL720_3891 [Aureococcus anophagefferens]|nr:hypothetical protein JL720_3891 [Aureococcus anophagefferens]